ncbi:MAG: cytochrome c biogenesis protein CcsA [Bacteroidetes bacterium]|nr:cytochrome c biogenesis protein CcsA [Bacteroidota bacterium]
MKKIWNLLTSSALTLILLLLFAIAIGVATFIEDKFDTITAQTLIYKSKWMEILLILLAVNFIGHINRYKLLSYKKLTGFIFHFAFVLLIVGAGVTRYNGFEGTMHIREGQTSSVIYTSNGFLQITANENGKEYKKDYELDLSPFLNNSFSTELKIENKGSIDFVYKNYIKNAVEVIEENAAGGSNIIELSFAVENNLQKIYLKNGEVKEIGNVAVAYNNNTRKDAINITDDKNGLKYSAPFGTIISSMTEAKTDTVAKDSTAAFVENYLYKSETFIFSFSKFYRNAITKLKPAEEGQEGIDALLLDVSYNGVSKEITVFGGAAYLPNFKEETVNGMKFKIAFGNKEIPLPFSIQLNKFVLERYPGSMSPSSFASEVTLVDSEKNINEPRRIFMNNVLDHRGFRFFQSSYDTDQKGTILSVNHDFWGTWISYFGYFLLTIGFIVTLFNKNSRFAALSENIKKIREKRKASALTVLFILGFSAFGFSQNPNTGGRAVSKEQADKFGHLIVQTFDGRFEPMHTMAYDVMHKISRMDNFTVQGKGELDAVQVFMDMILDQEFWKSQKMIYVREKSVQDIIGATDKYAAFNDFLVDGNKYKLAEYAEVAFRKKQSEQNTFDKEIIRVDERVNICMMAFQGSMLKIFPAQNSETNQWVSWGDSLANRPITGVLSVINEDLQLKQFNFSNILQLYFQRIAEGNADGNYTEAEKVLKSIETIQKSSPVANALPTKSRIDFEIYYNKAKIFENLRNVYGILSLILLILAFVENFKAKKSKILSIVLKVFIGILGLAFIYHTYGMGLRWYLSGHAPWSNGYEALLLVAWGGLLAGFYFVKYSKITLAATAVLAFSILMTAGHSSYDPQLTNLQPVLKSYWLIIHVAAITISYGFLGLGFILGLINMFLYILKTKKSTERIDLLIGELTYINEMNLSIGVALATLGTFLGGVWANESWGRYWGWDAKETWALVIVIVYAIVLHFRLVPKLKSTFVFNAASIASFGTVIMTFVGVNYYLSKGMHSYAAGDTPVFPIWAWITIFSVILLMVVAGIREKMSQKNK